MASGDEQSEAQIDEKLVEQCRVELPYVTDAFETLLRRYEPLVFRTCLRYLGQPQEAEEASQDAFLRVFHAVHRFEGRSKFRTWLYRIVANVCATRYAKLRKQAERRTAYMEHVQENAEMAYTSPEAELSSSGPVSDALNKLSSNDRHIVVLRHVSDLSVQEIADVIGVKLSAAKMRLHRAENRLKTEYQSITGKSSEKMPTL